MPTTRIALAIMTKQFKKADAGRIIGLAAACVGVMATIGHKDREMIEKSLQLMTKQVEAMPPETRDLLMTVADHFIEAARDGKDFMVMGGFEDGA